MDYKIAIYGNDIYKEVALPDTEEGSLSVGDTAQCQVRFSREKFFEDFMLTLSKKNGQWTIRCGDGIYLRASNALRQYMMPLHHGDTVSIAYEGSGVEIFRIEFMQDYDRVVTPYDRYTDISSQSQITIGGAPGCNLRLPDPGVQQDMLVLTRSGGGYILDSSRCQYGAVVNGSRFAQKSTTLRDGDFFSLAEYKFCVAGNALYFSSAVPISCPWPVQRTETAVNAYEYPKFVRNARVQVPLPKEKLEVLQPKTAPQEPKKNLLMTLAPMIASLILIVVLRGIMSSSNGMFVIYSAAMMIVSGVMSVWTYFNDGKEYKEQMARRTDVYNQYMQGQEQKVANLREKELSVLRKNYLSQPEDLELMLRFDQRLFERSTDDPDFLELYLGTGRRRSALPVGHKVLEYKDTDDPLQDYPAILAEKYEWIEQAPITLKLSEVNAVGITGNREMLYQFAKNITLDLTARHFYQDVKCFYILEKSDKDYFRWMRWFEHTWNENSDSRNFMYDEESAKRMLEYLYTELSMRERLDRKVIAALPVNIVFVYRSERLMLHPVSRYIGAAKELGFRFLFFEEHRELLPRECDDIIYLEGNAGQAVLQPCAGTEAPQPFSYPHVSSEQAARAALRMACVRVDEVNLESSLTRNITLYKLLGILAAPDLDLAKRWETSRVHKSMAAPIGVTSGDQPLYLDLHEKYHGPHGLVAGTTGSGKSELLQTYILSMATLFHPYEVSFVIIDFKGGGMVNQFENLPHLNGAITNIDGREIDRSLASIKAELKRRQRLFAEYGVNKIDAYIQLYKKGETPIPLPHLILIVDEFAELKMDQPDFMKELVSAARIGRSLGVHLILATQKPSGVVDAQIWSNSRFKLCLKVADKGDSNEVLKSPLAAEIREPGRAYLQVGNNEIFQLFQSAYSGAPVNADADTRKYQISRISFSGRRVPIYVKEPGQSGFAEETQLDALVSYIHNYCEQAGIEKLPSICLPPLAEVLRYEEAAAPAEEGYGTVVSLGIFDDPDQQRQEVYSLDLLSGHMLILGSSQSGKTNLLMLMLRASAERYASDQTWFYILDFGSMVLKNFEGLDHVGGVVLSNEDEKLKNLMKLLSGWLKQRKETFAGMGITSFSSYREAGYTDMPHVIVMIDNFIAMKELYPDYEDLILRLLREGLAVGITIILTSTQSSGIGMRYTNNISNRIALHCNQKDEYGSVFDGCRMQPKNVPGRGLIMIDKVIYEYQGFLPFEGEKEIERVEHMRQVIAVLNASNSGHAPAAPIPEVPEVVTPEILKERFGAKEQGWQVPAGVDYDRVELFGLNLANLGVLSLMGREQPRENMVDAILHHLYRNLFTCPSMVYILDDSRKHLKKYEECGIVARYSLDAGDIGEYVEEIHEMVSGREEDEFGGSDTPPLMVLLVQNREAVALLCKNAGALKKYKELIGKYKAMGVLVLYTDLEDAAVSYSGPEIFKSLRDNRNLLYFDNLSAFKFGDVPNPVLRANKKEIGLYDAFYMKGAAVTKVNTVISGEEWRKQWQM